MKVEDLLKFNNMSDKEKIRLGLLVAAIIIFALIMISNYRKGQGAAYEAVKKREMIIGKKREEAEAGKTAKKKPAQIQAMLREVGREDPFFPPSRIKTPTRPFREKLHLSGIVSNGERSLAIINDMLVGEGDMIEDKKIIKIKSKSVVIKEGDKEYTLKLGGFESQKGGI